MKKIHFAATLLAASLLLLSACDKETDVQAEKLRPVRVMQVSLSLVGNTRVFSGISKSEQQSSLSFKIAGTVDSIPIKIGDRLKKGDLIARLDAATYELKAEQSRASLAQAKAAERNANSTFQRTKGLYENNNASKTDMDSARANAESAQAQVRASEKALQLALLNVSYTNLRATEDCAIASTNIEINENVNSGSPVATVDCGNTIEVTVSVPESLIAEISNGQNVQVNFDAIPNKSFTGKVDEVGISATGNGSTFPITVLIDDEHPEIRSGLAAEVTMQFANAASSSNIYLPVSAVNSGNDGEYIFIAEDKGNGEAIVKKRKVVIGELTANGILIQSGLNAGENVIIAGTKVIRPEMTVLLKK